MRIQNNIPALNTNRQLGVNQSGQAKSTEKLSSGFRVNRAGDDAAGLSISEKMRSQIRGLNRASMNAQDGISMIQAAEGALQETHSILQRIRELAVQGANDVNQTEDRQAITKEINQLGVELDRIAIATNFNNKYVLSGLYSGTPDDVTISDVIAGELGVDTPVGPVNLQVGANTSSSNVIQIGFNGMSAKDLLGTEWTEIEEFSGRIAPVIGEAGFVPSASANDAVSPDGSAEADYFIGGFQALINVIDGKAAVNGEEPEGLTGISRVSDLRSTLGAVQNRLEHTVSNLDTVAENMQAAESRIRDVDMALEMINFTKYNILNQAATAMLAQANQQPQSVLSLLR